MNIEDEIKNLQLSYEDNPTIESLALLRGILVVAQDANKTSEGFRRLLTQLYPDNAHYVYELLQNARDANKDDLKSQNKHKPSIVRFILTKEYVEFEHNGWKLFNINDIESITALGISTKLDDPTNVGKFGVGFKSVFSITDRPEITSGQYHFAIENLFIPRILESIIINDTHILLPFDNPSKKPEKAMSEIEKELRGLGSEILLFLDEIEKIEYLLPDGNTLGYMQRVERNGITVINVDIPNEGRNEFHWLRFGKNVIIADENGNSILCTVAIAFKLRQDERREHQGKWLIDAPKNGGKVCIYFPANKEKSNLKFHIHAPFASTVARESVRAIESNNLLIQEIAKLTAEAIIEIKDKHRNMINIDFLGLLPNNDDDLTGSSREDDNVESLSYEPIRDAIIEVFQLEPLVPTKSGGLAPSYILYRDMSENSRISSVIGDDDLRFLTKREDAQWTTTNRTNSRTNRFLDSLDIDIWSSDELSDILNPKNDDDMADIEHWLGKKSDEWLMRLYALLCDEEILVESGLKIVRTIKGLLVRASDAYFLPPDDEDMPDDLNFVKRETYDDRNSKKLQKLAQSAHLFLDTQGVKEYNEKVKVQQRLKRYKQSNSLPIDEKHFDDICFFVDYMAKHPKGGRLFSNESFLIGERDGKTYWVSLEQLRIVPSELNKTVNELGLSFYRVWDGYNASNLGECVYASFDNFLSSINIKTFTEGDLVRERASKYSRTSYGKISANDKCIMTDIKHFIRFWRHNKDNSNDIIQIFRDFFFVLGSDEKLHRASDICIGLLGKYTDIVKMPTISEKYLNHIKNTHDFEKFLLTIGAKDKLEIKETIFHYNSSWCDHDISSLNTFLRLVENKSDSNASYLIWQALCTCDDSYSIYVHTPGRRDTHGESTIVTSLRTAKWIPQEINGSIVFVSPDEVSEEMLPEIFNSTKNAHESYGSAALLKAIKLGEKFKLISQQVNAEKKLKEEALHNLGLTENEVKFIREVEDEGLTIEEAREATRKAAAKKRIHQFPDGTTSTPGIRIEKIKKEYRDSSPVEYKTRPTMIRTSRSAIDPRPYLQGLYTNVNNEVICQICREPMPFKKRDGEYYFEMVEAFKPSLLSNEHESKYLILCPVCSAKYNEFIRYSRDDATLEMKRFYKAVKGYDEDVELISIQIEFGEELSSICFVQKHIGDLKAIIEAQQAL